MWPQPCSDPQQSLAPVLTARMCASFQASPAACGHPACSSHPQFIPPTHRHTPCAHLPHVCAYVQQHLLGIRSQAEGTLVFPTAGNRMGRHPAPLQGTGPSSLETRSSPEPAWDFVCPCSERCLLRQRWRCGRYCSVLKSLPAREGQNCCWFSGKTSSSPIPLEPLLQMEKLTSHLPAVCATSCCLCAPAARLHFLWKKIRL